MEASLAAYLDSWSAELTARANRVRQLIGDAHWLSDGHHKEAILRDFLVRYLPNDIVVSRGFVKSAANSSTCSPEVDILITDPNQNPPLFHEGGVQIVDSTAVLANIEVKSSLTTQTLRDSIRASCEIKEVASDQRSSDHVWSGIHFYYSKLKAKKVLEFVERMAKEGVKSRDGRMLNPHDWPTVISATDAFVMFIAVSDERQLKLRLFELGSMALPFALIDLFGHIRRMRGGAASSSFDELVERTPLPPPMVRTVSF